jgi:hypothetical protein
MRYESWNLNHNLREVWDAILDRCERHKKYTGYFMVCCPAHPDRDPSLEIKPNGEGDKILLRCQAGCDTSAVMHALGLEYEQLFADNRVVERETIKEQVPTLETLAGAKKLPVLFLKELGCTQHKRGVLIPYFDEDYEEITFRIRVKMSGSEKYVSKPGAKVSVYGADRLPTGSDREGKNLVLVEGETDSWTLWHHGIAALGISSSTHTKSLLKRHVEGFGHVYVVREPDAAGDKFVKGVAGRLYHHGFTGAVTILTLGEDKDPSGMHVRVGGDRDRFVEEWRNVLQAGEVLNVRETVHEEVGSERLADKPQKADQTADLFELGKQHAEVVLDEVSKHAVARITLDGERVDCPVKSRTFKNWLTRLYQQEKGKPALGVNLENAVNNVAAAYTKKVRTYCRVARVRDEVYYDLCSGGKVVEVTRDGWRVLEKSPVFFLRGADMSPQVEPVRDGTVADLTRLVNVAGDEFPLLVAFLLDAMKGQKPYLFASVHGPQGTGKSWVLHVVKSLIDPSKLANGLAVPKTDMDLFVLARHRHLIDFDNVTRIPAGISDALCRLSTGSGAATRTLYTNDEETVFGGANPCLFNGIPDFVERADLQGRTVSLSLPQITDAARRAEAELGREFDRLKPGILGAIFNLVSNGLRNLDTVPAIGGPRMMDSYRWLKACEVGTGLKLADVYKDHVEGAMADHATNDPLVQALLAALTDHFGRRPKTGHIWTGTASALYDTIKQTWLTDTRKEENQIPGNGRLLSNRLMMLAEPLSRVGVDVSKRRTNKDRFLVIDATRYFSPRRPDVEERHEVVEGCDSPLDDRWLNREGKSGGGDATVSQPE